MPGFSLGPRTGDPLLLQTDQQVEKDSGLQSKWKNEKTYILDGLGGTARPLAHPAPSGPWRGGSGPWGPEGPGALQGGVGPGSA